jgi:flavin-dependent dehydrogenase
MATPSHFDVAILGGGLAGASLARQLQLEAPNLRVVVIEKRPHPVREAAFKVGESTVEIGAHYFQVRLGLEPHLRSAQLEKLGLRYFFTHGANRDIASRVELGPTAFPPVPSFQLDRGRFENFLLATVREAGADVRDGCRIRRVTLGAAGHEIAHDSSAGPRTLTARWVVDASGRACLLKRQLGLARASRHGANACWFRIPARLRVDAWSTDAAWRARLPSDNRWLSTNHLMGRGYWVWLIPLGSGSTSVGIVADGDLHPYHRINRFERAMDWLREFEPQCAGMVEPFADAREDFLALQHYAHGCARVFSADRWALVGEAGVFTDPFYSPGSDFIAIGNDYTADLIQRDLHGEDVAARVESFNTIYLRLFDAFIRLYEGQYRIMGNAQVMTAKIAWDNACYWAVPARLFFQRRLRDPAFIDSIEPLMRRFFVLHARMQQLLRAWDAADADAWYPATAASVVDVEWLRVLQASLDGPALDDDALRARMAADVEALEAFARGWQAHASACHPTLARFINVDDRRDAPAAPAELVLTPAPTAR